MKKQQSFNGLNKRYTLFASVISYCVLLVLFAIFYKKIRDFFPPSIITKTDIIGYSQYFGYPFYFDTFVYWAFIIAPFAIIHIILWINRNKKYD